MPSASRLTLPCPLSFHTVPPPPTLATHHPLITAAAAAAAASAAGVQRKRGSENKGELGRTDPAAHVRVFTRKGATAAMLAVSLGHIIPILSKLLLAWNIAQRSKSG